MIRGRIPTRPQEARYKAKYEKMNKRSPSANPVVLPQARRQPFGVADLFKVGIGPSSSHTVGPMKAAAEFRGTLTSGMHDGRPLEVARLRVVSHGSLAWTGKGHATDRAIVLGLAGERPESIDPDQAEAKARRIDIDKRLRLRVDLEIDFDPSTDVVFDFGEPLGRHPNAMTFEAFGRGGALLLREIWYSVGGGFVEREGDDVDGAHLSPAVVPYIYANARELLSLATQTGLSVAGIALANEEARSSEAEAYAYVDRIAAIMADCIERGLSHRGILPGGLKVRRRAAEMHSRLVANRFANVRPPNEAMDYASVYAMAVNEENAAGGRIVTAPTNGASGVIPAVVRYYREFHEGGNDGIRTLLLTASAVGDLIKRNASISGAEVGCQGEVGSAAAMAAAGLCAALGGTPQQVLNAAEVGLEHHLGMTCDPIGGLVQIPCIERNAFGAVKAINAASLALHGDGSHFVSLDQVIETMRQTGFDMKSAYRETSRGGLAVNVPEC